MADVAETAKNEALDIVLRLHTDAEFFEIVKKVSELDSESLKVLQRFLREKNHPAKGDGQFSEH